MNCKVTLAVLPKVRSCWMFALATWACGFLLACAGTARAEDRARIERLRAALDRGASDALEQVEKSELAVREALVPNLMDLFERGDWRTAVQVRWILVDVGRSAPESVVPRVLERLERADREDLAVRLPMIELLRDLAAALSPALTAVALPVFVDALRDPDLSIQREAVWAVQAIPWVRGPDAKEAVPALMELLASEDALIRRDTVRALGCIGPGLALVPALMETLKSEYPRVRRFALDALAEIGPGAARAVPALIEVLKGDDRSLRLRAARALGEIGPSASQAIPVLLDVAEGQGEGVLLGIEAALRKMKTRNEAPTVQPVSFTCKEGEEAEMKLPVRDTDDLSVALEAVLAADPEHGSLERTGPRAFVYRSRRGFAGEDSFRWKATDGRDTSPLATVTITIAPDRTAPSIDEVIAVGDGARVTVTFSEPVLARTAGNAGNYALSPGVRVDGAELGRDGRTVTLSTSRLSPGQSYTLEVSGVSDRARAENAIRPAVRKTFELQVWEPEGLLLLAGGDGNARDASGEGHHGKISSGVSYEDDGVKGKAFRFAGVSGDRKNAVSFGDIDALDAAGRFTIAFWFRRAVDLRADSNHGVSNIMFSQGSDSDNDNIEIGTQGSRIEVYLDTAQFDGQQSCDASVRDAEWYHLALTYDRGRTQEAQLFLNGALAKSWTNWGGSLDSANTSPVTIGNTHHEETPFRGTLDEILVFRRVLRAEEVRALYDSGGAGRR